MTGRFERSPSEEGGDRGRPTGRQGDRSRSPSNETPEDRQARLERLRRDNTRNLIPVPPQNETEQQWRERVGITTPPQTEQLQQPLEATEQLYQSLGNLYRRGYQNLTSAEQTFLDQAFEVASDMRRELNSGPGDQRTLMLGDILQGGAARISENPGLRQTNLTEEERESDLRNELKESFLTRLQAKMRENSANS